MSGSDFGWLQINMENFQQCVELILMPRHFGGGQWYFVCSELNRPASVLWRPPPTGKRRLFTAHTHLGHWVAASEVNWLPLSHSRPFAKC
jgi:hypothetical protein